jgi:hypothetical protein
MSPTEPQREVRIWPDRPHLGILVRAMRQDSRQTTGGSVEVD